MASRWPAGAAAAAISIALHLGAFWLLARVEPEVRRVEAVEIEIALPPPAEPVRRPALEPRRPARRLAPAARPAPPPPSEPPPASAEPPERAPIRVGVTLSATSPAGTTAAPVGNTLRGKPPERAGDPQAVAPYRAERYASPTEVSSLPVPLQVAVPDAEYPPEARRMGVEARVRLRLVVDERGRVASARVLSDPGYGLGDAAARVARRYFRFRPALRAGEPVATEIPFTVSFELR